VLLDGIEDVHNLGAIIRTAECAGVHAVLVPKRRSAPLNETVGKTSRRCCRVYAYRTGRK
jgi:23S rRNA (guanosine2251-2'-O)-methyltransferase